MILALCLTAACSLLALLIPVGVPYSRLWRPSFLLSLFSFLGLVITSFYFSDYDLDPKVPELFALGTISFLLGDAAVSWLTARRSALHNVHALEPRHLVSHIPLMFVYLGLGAIGAVLLVYLYFLRSAMFNMFELGMALRYAESIARLPTLGAYHFLIFAQCAGSVLVLSERRWLRVVGYACYGVIVFGSFVAVSRTLIFYAVCSLSFLMYVRSRSFLPVAVPVAIVSILSFAYATFARKDIIQGESGFITYYFGYGIVAFQQYVWPLTQYEWGVNSFGILGSLALGGAQSVDLTLTIDEWNVYTFIAAPYRDFGVLGVILVPFLFGGLWSSVWNSLDNRPFYLLIYSWMIFPCVIPFFDWKFSFTSYLYLIAAYLVFLRVRFTPFDGEAADPVRRPRSRLRDAPAR